MRFLFFLLLKLIEVAGVLVVIFITAVIVYISLRFDFDCPVWLLKILGIGAILLLLGFLLCANWIMAGAWADKWRKRKQERTEK